MESKIKLKVGSIEVKFEGSEEYIRDELPTLVELLHTLSDESFDIDEEEEEILPDTSNPAKKKLELTTNTIATKLDVKSGPSLVLAACAHLTFVKGAETFHRKNILAEIKLATNYYKKSHTSNLSHSLKSLVKDGKLIERKQDTYALDAGIKKQLGATLGAA